MYVVSRKDKENVAPDQRGCAGRDRHAAVRAEWNQARNGGWHYVLRY